MLTFASYFVSIYVQNLASLRCLVSHLAQISTTFCCMIRSIFKSHHTPNSPTTVPPHNPTAGSSKNRVDVPPDSPS